jgi:hypothetical protein
MKSNTLKAITFILMIFVTSPQLFAHALWIETKATGTKGKPQEISVFFGEFSENDITPTSQWFSDIKDFSLVAISPTNQQIKLLTVASEKKYQAYFTPEEDGVYTIIMQHTVKDLYGSMKLDYNSSATVVVGNQLKGNEAIQNTNEISLFTQEAAQAKVSKSVTVNAWYGAKIAKNQKLKVIAPNGWEKELYSNDKGEITFTPIWSGNYMVEFAYSEKTTGEHNAQKYDEIWKMATYFITVK